MGIKRQKGFSFLFPLETSKPLQAYTHLPETLYITIRMGLTLGNVSPIRKKYKQGKVDPHTERSHDPFKLEGSDDYSEEFFYCRSTDGHGHSDNYQVRVPPEISAALGWIVQSGKIPEYRKIQAIFRDALIHRLHFISSLMDDPRLEEVVTVERQLTKLYNRQQKMKAIKDVIAQTESILREAAEIEDWDSLGDSIQDAEQAAELMPRPYQIKLEQVMAPYIRQLKAMDN